MPQTSLPVRSSRATRRPSSRPTKILPSPMPTPRLVQPQQTDVIFGSMLASDCQRISPVSTDSAKTSSAPVITKTTPSWTIGCASPEYCGATPEPFRCVRQTPLSCANVAAVDLRERRVALVAQVAAVRAPTVARRRRQRLRRKRAVPLRDCIARHGDAHARARPPSTIHRLAAHAAVSFVDSSIPGRRSIPSGRLTLAGPCD